MENIGKCKQNCIISSFCSKLLPINPSCYNHTWKFPKNVLNTFQKSNRKSIEVQPFFLKSHLYLKIGIFHGI